MVGFSEVHSSYSQIFHGFHFWSVFPWGILIIVVVISVIFNGSLGRLRNFVIFEKQYLKVSVIPLRERSFQIWAHELLVVAAWYQRKDFDFEIQMV
jgi:hypothetical protein